MPPEAASQQASRPAVPRLVPQSQGGFVRPLQRPFIKALLDRKGVETV